MEEYVSEAIVLKHAPQRDLDRRYSLFTQKFGKMIGKAKSARKITSKLAPHLEPGSIVRVRFIEKNGTQIVDALKVDHLSITLRDLDLLNELLPENQPESELWDIFTTQDFSWANTLKILGWDPEGALCANCGKSDAPYFYIRRQEFFCRNCASRLRPNEVLLVSTSNGEI